MSEWRSARTVQADGVDEAARWADATLGRWGLVTPLRTAWLPWARRFAGLGSFELQYEYDVELGLLTCDLFRDGRRLFGLDDYVPLPSATLAPDLEPALTWP